MMMHLRSNSSLSQRLWLRKVAALAVHLYTASGGILAFFALVDIAAHRFEHAMLLLGIALLIDGTDGFLARRLSVGKLLPTINGEILDLVIDFVTYAIAPLFLLWHANLLPSPPWLWAVLILIAAHYDFANIHPLKHKGLYTGLPAVWNLYAFHVLYLRPSEAVQIICIIILLIFTFAPLHFICISRLKYLQPVSIAAMVVYLAILLAVMLGVVADHRRWALIALLYPAWYAGSSFWVHFRFHNGLLQMSHLPAKTNKNPL